jgi:hypothetical protein
MERGSLMPSRRSGTAGVFRAPEKALRTVSNQDRDGASGERCGDAGGDLNMELDQVRSPAKKEQKKKSGNKPERRESKKNKKTGTKKRKTSLDPCRHDCGVDVCSLSENLT